MKFRRRLDELGRLDDNSLEDFAAHRNSFDESHIAYLDMNLTSNKWIEYLGKTKISKKNWIDFEVFIHSSRAVFTVLQTIMGHANITVTLDVYTHLDFSQIQAKVEEIEDKINIG
jgi:integrase